MKTILLLHGANLNCLGKRNPHYYGYLSLKELEDLTAKELSKFSCKLHAYQSNHEGCLIDTLQSQAIACNGIIINPGAFTHTSYALHDALYDTGLPTVEVHLSAITQREKWRRKSVITAACIDVISGKQEHGYIEAVHVLMEHLKK
jgi:3-dehydroquinate dehydratase-2